MKIVAIDPSMRSCGVYIPSEEKSFAIRSIEHEYYALHGIFLEIGRLFKNHRPDIMVIEMLAFSRHSRGVSSMGEVHGIIKALAVHYGVRIEEMASSTWKSYIFGSKKTNWPQKKKTKRGTEEYLNKVWKATGRKFNTTDEADAYMIYRTYINGTDTLYEVKK